MSKLKLENIELVNVGIHEGLNIEFQDGFNCIYANNGKGKSTLLDSIYLGLGIQGEKKLEEYLNNNSETFKISLVFYFDNIKYKSNLAYTKKGKTGTSSRELFKNNELFSDDTSYIKTYLSDLLSSGILPYATMVGQNNDVDIVKATPTERKNIIGNIFQALYTDWIKKEVEPTIMTLKEKKNDFEKEIYSLESREYNLTDLLTIPFSEDELKGFKENLETLDKRKKEIEDYNNKIDNVKKEVAEIKLDMICDKNRGEDIAREKIEINSNVKSIKEKDYEKDFKEINDKIDVKINEKSLLEKELNDKKETLNKETSSKIKEHEEKRDSLEEEKKEASKFLSRIAVVDHRSKLNEVNQKETKALTQLDQAKKDLKDFEGGICPKCGGIAKGKIEEYTKVKETLEKTLEEIEIEKHSIELEKEAYDLQVKNNDEAKSVVALLNNKLENINNQLDITNNTLVNDTKSLDDLFASKQKGIENEIIALKETLVNQEQVKALELQRVEDFEKRLNEYTLEESKLELSISKKELRILEKEKDLKESKSFSIEDQQSLVDCKEKIKAYDDCLIKNDQIKETNRQVEKTKEKDLSILKNVRKDFEEVNSSLYDYEQSKMIMSKSFPNYVIAKNIGEMEANLNQVISDLYYKDLEMSFKITDTTIDLRYGEDKAKRKLSAKNCLSGAEHRLVVMALVVVMNQKLGYKFLCMDEPEQSLNPSVIPLLADIIQNIHLKSIDQSIIISHDKALISILDCNNDVNMITL